MTRLDSLLMRWIFYVFVAFNLGPMSSCEEKPAPIDPVKLQEAIEARIKWMEQFRVSDINGRQVRSTNAFARFYYDRKFDAAWINPQGLNKPLTDLVLEAVHKADAEGLEPGDYHSEYLSKTYAYLNSLLSNKKKSKPDLDLLVNFELLLSDAYLTYANDLYYGKVCPENVDPDWHAACKEVSIDFADYLTNAIDDELIEESLKRLTPRNKTYKGLKDALAFYKRLDMVGLNAGLPFNGRLPVADSQQIYIRHLKMILKATGDLPATGSEWRYELIAGLKQFQQRHGLKNNGLLDSLTLKALHTSFKERIKSLEINLERWRWLPLDLGEEYLIVNIADFTLKIVKKDAIMFKSKVVVGTPFHRTPVFTAEITHLILNPYWFVPRSIVKNEILSLPVPEEFLRRHQIRVLDKDECEIPFDSINWEQVTDDDRLYQFRQDPGPANSLGLIKVIFPNDYLVFIHDTPAKSLFEESVRTFSHGCIRVHRPFELADYLLRDDPNWHIDRLRAFTQTQDSINKRVDLPKPMPVHILYWTAWVDKLGLVHFREDIYGRDEALWKALKTSYKNVNLNRKE